MLITEAEARERWCPFGRALASAETPNGGVALTAVNLGRSLSEATNCIAGRCMAWRWAGWRTSFGTIASSPPLDERRGPLLGFCGLAGQPLGHVDQPIREDVR